MNQEMKEEAWLSQAFSDMKRHEGYREYAYPDPLSKWGKLYPERKYKWGRRPASVIMAELGLDVKDVRDGAPWTIGWGFTHGVKYNSRTTHVESDPRLKQEIIDHAKGLDSLIPGWRTEQPLVVQTVLVNLIYNMGTTKLSKFAPTLARIEQGKYAEAAARIEKTPYYSQTGVRSKELVKRLRTGKIEPQHLV